LDASLPVLAGTYPPGLLAALGVIVAVVLIVPFTFRKVEENLEVFLFVMGCLAVSVAGAWSGELVLSALRDPFLITLVVLIAGLAFHFGRSYMDHHFGRLRALLGTRATLFAVVAGLGLLSSVMTAIIAALLLVEVVHLLRLGRREEIRLTVITCFSIGLGAALTPVGEPLSTIVTAKFRGDFWTLARLLGLYILPGILVLGGLTAFLDATRRKATLKGVHRRDPLSGVFLRAVKVYAFVAALLLLGEGLYPLVDRYIARLPSAALFWANMISAVLDNATLAAAEVGPAMSPDQLTAVLLGLLVSGGMLIPGNIPNIISAGHLKIGSREWAAVGVPLGLVLMVAYFAAWFFLR
jgi:predicted cation transporter